MTVNGTFEWTLTNGKQARIEVSYDRHMTYATDTFGGEQVNTNGEREPWDEITIKAYVDDKLCGQIYNAKPYDLKLQKNNIFVDDGIRIIPSLGVGFNAATADKAAEYEAWIADIIERGTSDEAKAYDRAMELKRLARDAEDARQVLADAKAQGRIPETRAEARAMERKYNEVNNEGGEGYCPEFRCRADVERAEAAIAAYEAAKAAADAEPKQDVVIDVDPAQEARIKFVKWDGNEFTCFANATEATRAYGYILPPAPDTPVCIASVDNGLSATDLDYIRASVYHNPDGAYQLHVTGGARGWGITRRCGETVGTTTRIDLTPADTRRLLNLMSYDRRYGLRVAIAITTDEWRVYGWDSPYEYVKGTEGAH